MIERTIKREYFKNNKKGFVLLYTMILSSIILAVAFGILRIAFKETNFGISARAANEAFFAADTGAECAIYHDKIDPAMNAFSGTLDQMMCAGQNISLNSIGTDAWSFVVSNLGESGVACAKVTLIRDPGTFSTTVVSKGYNKGGDTCDAVSGNVVERQLELTY
jgi:hypothetical protein